MTAAFAQAIADLSGHVIDMLSDVDVLFLGIPQPGILKAGFENPTLAGPGPAGYSPSVLLPAASVPARSEGLPLTILSGIAAGNYKVTEQEPDGTGLVTLHLTKTKA